MLMEQINVMGFWNRFDEAREVSIAEVAKATGINNGSLRNLHSSGKLPNLPDTVVIADYLGVSLDWLVLGKVTNDRESKISKVVKAYLDADEVSKIAVERILRLDL